MLSPQLLELLRLWRREGRRRGVMLPHGWLFPGRSCTDPISSRQLYRAVPCSVLEVHAPGLLPEFIIMITDADGWTHLTRTHSVRRQGDEAEVQA